MGLVTATAFQQSPAVQTRAFVALSALAVAEVDDDFLYQILVAFKGALMKATESNTTTIVSMLRCMCKIVPAIVETSRYVGVLFWLAVALLQSSHVGFYVEATWLLRITLENMELHGMFIGNSVEDVLLEAREQLEEVASQLDQLLKINFKTNFSIALASIIFKGMRHTLLKDSAQAVLRSLLRVTTVAHRENNKALNGQTNGINHTPCLDAMGYFLALIPVSTTPKSYRQLLKEAQLDDKWIALSGLRVDDEEDTSIPQPPLDILGINDNNTALLVASFVGTMLANAQGDDAETQILYGLLSSLAKTHPDIIGIT
jgi:general stress protein CsbA